MATRVVDQFFAATVLADLPREELIERISVHLEQGGGVGIEIAGFGIVFRSRQNERVGGFIRQIEGAIRGLAEFVVGGLGIACEMIPAGEDDPAEAINDGIESAGRSMAQELQVSCGGIQAPQAGDGGEIQVLFALGIKVGRSIARAITGEKDAAVGAIGWGDVVVTRRLIRDFGDGGRLAGSQSGDLIELPEELSRVGRTDRCANDHAKHRFGAIPVNGGIADRLGVGALEAVGGAEAGGQIAQCAIRIADIEVTTASGRGGGSEMVGKRGADIGRAIGHQMGGEFVRNRDLGDEQNRIR